MLKLVHVFYKPLNVITVLYFNFDPFMDLEKTQPLFLPSTLCTPDGCS